MPNTEIGCINSAIPRNKEEKRKKTIMNALRCNRKYIFRDMTFASTYVMNEVTNARDETMDLILPVGTGLWINCHNAPSKNQKVTINPDMPKPQTFVLGIKVGMTT